MLTTLYATGLSSRAIAKQMGTNHRTVLNRLHEAGVVLRTKAEGQRGKARPHTCKPVASKPCPFCGKPITDKPGRLERRIYCSRQCHGKARPHPALSRPALLCEWCGKQYQPKEVYEAKERRFCCHPCSLAWNASNISGHTSIERTVCQWLSNMGLAFRTQAPIGQFMADILLECWPIVIECDGEYWHSLPGIPARDRMRNIIMRRLGYSVLRLPEQEITKQPEHSRQRILAIIKRHSSKMGIPLMP